MTAVSAMIALNRFGLGPRPGDVVDIADDPRGALEEELRPGVALIGDPRLPSSTEALAAIRDYRMMRRSGSPAGNKPAAMARRPSVSFYRLEFASRLDRIVTAKLGFVERLVAFWTNHFAVEAGAGQVERGLVGAFEREAIRPNVLGSFRDMLIAATRHPAMLSYLDNQNSIGPNSRVGRRRSRGLNENHAREILELHTVGVDAGYTQADVTALARVLTGWTFIRGRRREPIGAFIFRANAHEPGDQTVLGKVYEDSGEAQGLAVLDDLARHPTTARHIATKLARSFVADEPPPALVNRIETVFRDSDGDLAEISRALVRADESWGEPRKLKTPQEFLWSSYRALDLARPGMALRVLRTLGQRPWDPPSPAGFDDRSATWLAPDAVNSRLDASERLAAIARPRLDPTELLDELFSGSASPRTREAVTRAESRTQGLALLLMSPEFQRR